MADQSRKEVFEFVESTDDQVGDRFRVPDEPQLWWLLNFYFELPFYLPYLDGATFNVSLPQDVWAPPIPADLSVTPSVLLSVTQTPVLAPPGPAPSPPSVRRLRSDGQGWRLISSWV